MREKFITNVNNSGNNKNNNNTTTNTTIIIIIIMIKKQQQEVEEERSREEKNRHTKYKEGEQTKEINGMCKLLFRWKRAMPIWVESKRECVCIYSFHVLNHILHEWSSFSFCHIPAASASAAAIELWQIETNTNPSIIWHFYYKHTKNVLKFQRIERKNNILISFFCWTVVWDGRGDAYKNIPLPI